MKTMFDAVNLGGIELKNRMVRSATLEKDGGSKGRLTPRMTEIYTRLAKGGVGLILTGMMGVSPNAGNTPDMVKMYADGFEEDLKALTDSVHAAGGKLVVQLGHSGAKALGLDKGALPYAPSQLMRKDTPITHAMTEADITEAMQGYANSAAICQRAGVDGVEIHGAHGFLVNQFLNPFYNQRTDQYGGSLENRARFLLEAYDAIRAAVGPDYPVFVKINASDFFTPGFTFEECVWVCKELAARGVSALEVSGGLSMDAASTSARPVKGEEDEACFSREALQVAKEVDVPVFTVGSYRTPEVVEKVLNEGELVAISLGRPLICEPELLDRWQKGERAKSMCISCNHCFVIPKHGCLQPNSPNHVQV